MLRQKVKFVTGFGSFGGSTVAMIEHCRLLGENGFEVELYAEGEWHMSRFDGSRRICDLRIERDDILVFHHKDLEVRPKCKKCLLYLHEKSLWPLGERNLLPFDGLVYVSEDQKEFHGRPGAVIPNPVRRMVDPGVHNPPGKNIAGIVGTIQSRKRQHLSIARALEDGRDQVLLFGDFEKSYFDKMIRPMLSDKVVHMGLVDPDRRMEMYSTFDCLYMFSEDESASLVLGECRILGKDVFKSDEVKDYEMVDDREIVSRWRDIFENAGQQIGGSAVIPRLERCGRLVCVVTHKRKELVSRWLRAWNNSEKFGAKIAVLHACDGESPDEIEMKSILSHSPDFYIPFKNSPLRDMMALHLVVREAVGLPDWDELFWFTDDMIPMRKDFLSPFVDKMTEGVGLVAQCYEPMHDLYEEKTGNGCLPHIRTVAYALSRAAADSLVFPAVGNESDRPYLFEHGRIGVYEKHILRQVLDNGFSFRLCHSEPGNYKHWTQTLDWMWDCHFFSDGAEVGGRRLSARDMWDIYESQFCGPSAPDPMLIFSPEACERMVSKKGMISAILPTFSSPMNCFMWSVFSLLIRSDPRILSHLFVAINGPDSREGGNELQDTKQSFLEELRSCDWSGMQGFNPGSMTISRTWSRIGHAQALEQCIPWVDTEYYLSIHDDVVVMDSSWCDLSDFVDNRNMVIKTWGNHLACKLGHEGNRLEMPHLNTIFTLCSRPLMARVGSRWMGCHLEGRFRIEELTDARLFERSHAKAGSMPSRPIPDKEYGTVSIDIGSFILSRMSFLGLEAGRFAPSTIRHFESASWNNRVVQKIPEVDFLESQIFSIPQYGDIYSRYMNNV